MEEGMNDNVGGDISHLILFGHEHPLLFLSVLVTLFIGRWNRDLISDQPIPFISPTTFFYILNFPLGPSYG
jgi:hypothetical protein